MVFRKHFVKREWCSEKTEAVLPSVGRELRHRRAYVTRPSEANLARLRTAF